MIITPQELDSLHCFQEDRGLVSLYIGTSSEDSHATFQHRLSDLVTAAERQLDRFNGHDNYQSSLLSSLKNLTRVLSDSFVPDKNQTHCSYSH